MKKIIPFSLLTILLAASLVTLNSNSIKETKAYTVSSLTKVINLNDSDDSTIRDYYSSLNGLSNEEKTGTNLLKNLKPILKNGQKYYSYESKTAIWQMYEIIDRDWDKSPASALPESYQYDSSTNTIKKYTYGTSNSNKGSDPYVHALYINRDVDNETKAWGNHNQDQWGINQEHIWPKSHGFEEEGKGGARGDPMHLWAGNGYSNNIHSNWFYGYVDTTKSYEDCGNKYSNQKGNLKGTSKTIGSGTVFEPQDSDKGDIARAVFYMVARYNYLSGSDSDGIDCNNPNLELVNESVGPSKGYQSTTAQTGKLGVLSDLLEWNKLDPVDEFERHRNNLLFNNYTNNRNPFIDFPEWADLVWGDKAGTTYASPMTDAINGNDSGLTISATRLSLEEGKTGYVVATTKDNSQVTWEIEDDTVASMSLSELAQANRRSSIKVNSGSKVYIKGLKEGTTKLTAKAHIEDEDVEASCTITISKHQDKPATDEETIDPLDFIKKLDTKTLIIIGVVAFVVIIIVAIIIAMSKSKKTRKKTTKTTTKTTKKGGRKKK